MESIDCKQSLKNQMMIATLNSWRFILLMMTPPFISVFYSGEGSVIKILSLLLAALIIFNCWRLWLDSTYFSLLEKWGCDDQTAGEALFYLWKRPHLKKMSLSERHCNSARLLRHSLYQTLALWGLMVVCLFYA